MDLWAAIRAERASLHETFGGLGGDQWDVPSLCGGWTVRQVLGHLVFAAQPPMGRFGLAALKAAGSFDKANDRLARAEAERPTAELVERYGQLRDARWSPPAVGPKAPLSDIVLHSLDVRIPLGLPTERPVEHHVPVLDLLLSRRGALFAPRGRPSLRWVATDHDWSGGSGDEVQGTMSDLALAASGRGARVTSLTGPGQPALAAWLAR